MWSERLQVGLVTRNYTKEAILVISWEQEVFINMIISMCVTGVTMSIMDQQRWKETGKCRLCRLLKYHRCMGRQMGRNLLRRRGSGGKRRRENMRRVWQNLTQNEMRRLKYCLNYKLICWSKMFQAQANQTHVKIAGLMSVATVKEFHLNEEILNEISRGKL